MLDGQLALFPGAEYESPPAAGDWEIGQESVSWRQAWFPADKISEGNPLSPDPEIPFQGSSVIERPVIERPPHRGCVGRYSKGNRTYWRFSYREKGKVKHHHIGATDNGTAYGKVLQILMLQAEERTVEEILGRVFHT
jgi:hypothetical protein